MQRVSRSTSKKVDREITYDRLVLGFVDELELVAEEIKVLEAGVDVGLGSDF